MDPVKVLIFGTIATAEDFENDDLFVHYFFHLENGWTSSCPLFGVTQCSRTRSKRRVEVAHFSHPFEIELERTAADVDQEGESLSFSGVVSGLAIKWREIDTNSPDRTERQKKKEKKLNRRTIGGRMCTPNAHIRIHAK
ncbi:uncharacterized protein LOC125944403 [Dermacentor silvarum]|uniref:uncharacterized protein LOC125944403 n=1 Tax=Dermacentor silvarum TaxID=543639 RepID=UPI002100B488|nr:uncharacterized protein LOC125944403 [Dermacentor silvarum]